MDQSPLTLVLAFVLAVLAVGRASRLATHDHWPPMLWLRLRWIEFWGVRYDGRHGAWAMLLTCPFCFAPYAAAVDLAWVLAAGLEWGPFWSSSWWVVNAWAALAYLAAIVVVYDEPAEVD